MGPGRSIPPTPRTASLQHCSTSWFFFFLPHTVISNQYVVNLWSKLTKIFPVKVPKPHAHWSDLNSTRFKSGLTKYHLVDRGCRFNLGGWGRGFNLGGGGEGGSKLVTEGGSVLVAEEMEFNLGGWGRGFNLGGWKGFNLGGWGKGIQSCWLRGKVSILMAEEKGFNLDGWGEEGSILVAEGKGFNFCG